MIGAYVTTATTVADSQGYVLCVGQVISDASSPMNGRTIPNINNDVFLMGSTASDAPGGSNSTMLTNTQLPSHTHGAGSYATSLGVTGGTASLTGTTTFPAFNHTHAFGHSHAWGAGSPSFLETRFTDDYTSTTGGSDVFQANSPFGNGPSSSIAIPQMLASAVTTFYTSGITQSAGVGTGAFASTGVESADSTVGISSTPASTTGSNSVTGSSSSTGTGSAYDSRPLFISCVYLMRIK